MHKEDNYYIIAIHSFIVQKLNGVVIMNTLRQTAHFESRQAQRGITHKMVDIVMAFGESTHGDKIMLTQKQAIQLSKEIDFILLTSKAA